MLRNSWNKQQHKNSLSKQLQVKQAPQLIRKNLSTKVPLIIDDEFMNKVRFLCKEVPKDEWSGILFYTIEGSIKDLSTFKCIAKDILPMDIGNKTRTEYNFDERYIDYMQKDEERLDWEMGHIHSHNTMDTYFSGVDMAELNDNCPSYRYYLSLIVNNFESMCAMIAMKSTMEGYTLQCIGEDSQPYDRNIIDKQDIMLLLECEITQPKSTIRVPDEFYGNFCLVKEYAKKAKQVAAKKTNPNTRSKDALDFDFDKSIDDWWMNGTIPTPEEEEEDESLQLEAVSDELTKHIFAFGNPEAFPSMATIFDNFDAEYKKNPIVKRQLMDHFETLFCTYFEETKVTINSIFGQQLLENVLGNIALFSEYNDDLFNSIILELEKKYENKEQV